MSPRKVCRFHCAACGSHHASLESFDLHRQGDRTAGEGRRCVEPLDEPGFHLVTDEGVCRMYAEPREPVRIWTSERAAKARESLIAAVRGPNAKDGSEDPPPAHSCSSATTTEVMEGAY